MEFEDQNSQGNDGNEKPGGQDREKSAKELDELIDNLEID